VSPIPEVGEPTRADRLAFIIDSAPYFAAFMDAVTRAQRSVLILGWEVDSDIRLRRELDGETEDPTLAEFLSGVLEKRSDLHIHVLCWDWSMIYLLEREPWPRYTMGHNTHERLHFELDGKHPVGASHHEKLVVVDDRVAFIGGIDLGRRRWDTRRHDPDDPRLTSPADRSYRPFHDVQAVVSGDAARTLGDRARLRWRRATGERLDPAPEVGDDQDPWPGEIEPVIRDVPVRLVRTDPADDLYETEAWHVHAIESSRRTIYVENQYVTSDRIGDALEAALDHPDGPEVAIVTSRVSGGWLEQASMDAQRARLFDRLRNRASGERLGLWWPDPGHGDSPTVHTKLTVIDDRRAYLGSANLSNRSMGLDTESGLTFDADDDERLGEVIADLRRSLLGEHLGTDAAAVASAEASEGGMLAAIESLRSGDRTLRELESSTHPLSGVLEPIQGLVDPERPARVDDLVPGLRWTQGDADADR
jgi:phosphatidylserine/phosphatidylglycerophosphate/cardiolipin synthase-like enzyme